MASLRASSTSSLVLGSANRDAACTGGKTSQGNGDVEYGSGSELDSGSEGKVGQELSRHCVFVPKDDYPHH